MKVYDFLFVKPAYWFAETVVYKWMDQGVIDGILHIFGHVTDRLGSTIRNYFDLPVINRFFGDGSADVTLVVWRPPARRPDWTHPAVSACSRWCFIVVGAALYFFLLA
jgi:hypothetical protein